MGGVSLMTLALVCGVWAASALSPADGSDSIVSGIKPRANMFSQRLGKRGSPFLQRFGRAGNPFLQRMGRGGNPFLQRMGRSPFLQRMGRASPFLQRFGRSLEDDAEFLEEEEE